MEKEIKEILFRYFVGMVIAVVALIVPIFYFIFRPITVWPTIGILSIFYSLTYDLTTINIGTFSIEIIDACIAGSAFLLLFILNILTRNIGLKKRFFIFIFDSALLLIMNILRLVILIILFVNKSTAFDITHNVFWYGISTIYVLLIWLLTIWIFKIKAVPFFGDIKFILSKKTRKTKNKN